MPGRVVLQLAAVGDQGGRFERNVNHAIPLSGSTQPHPDDPR